MQVRQRTALGVLSVGQQGGGGSVRLRQVLRLPGGQAGGLQLLQQFALSQARVKLPVGSGCDGQAPR